MKPNSVVWLAVLACAFVFAGCATRQDTGRVIGGATGAAVGSQVGDGGTAAILLGTVIGAAIGDRIGARMDRDDEVRSLTALEENRTDETTTWRNPDTGAQWAFTPTRTYTDDDRPCREFETVVEYDGDSEQVDGVACRTGPGTWEVVQN